MGARPDEVARVTIRAMTLNQPPRAADEDPVTAVLALLTLAATLGVQLLVRH
jgi:hypothetical protein